MKINNNTVKNFLIKDLKISFDFVIIRFYFIEKDEALHIDVFNLDRKQQQGFSVSVKFYKKFILKNNLNKYVK